MEVEKGVYSECGWGSMVLRDVRIRRYEEKLGGREV